MPDVAQSSQGSPSGRGHRPGCGRGDPSGAMIVPLACGLGGVLRRAQMACRAGIERANVEGRVRCRECRQSSSPVNAK